MVHTISNALDFFKALPDFIKTGFDNLSDGLKDEIARALKGFNGNFSSSIDQDFWNKVQEWAKQRGLWN